jgi:YD repeat-containing protein
MMLFESASVQFSTLFDDCSHATINDGTGTYWTSKYTYTTFDAVSTKTDARGVVKTHSYDALNRLTQVSYNTVSGVTTAPTVTYT